MTVRHEDLIFPTTTSTAHTKSNNYKRELSKVHRPLLYNSVLYCRLLSSRARKNMCFFFLRSWKITAQLIMCFYVQKDKISLQTSTFPGEELLKFSIFHHHSLLVLCCESFHEKNQVLLVRLSHASSNVCIKSSNIMQTFQWKISLHTINFAYLGSYEQDAKYIFCT